MCRQYINIQEYIGKSDAVLGDADIESANMKNADMENSFFEFDAFVSVLKPKSLVLVTK